MITEVDNQEALSGVLGVSQSACHCVCAPSSKSEGVEKAIFRPEEMDKQILTEGTLACGGSWAKPQNSNREG